MLLRAINGDPVDEASDFRSNNTLLSFGPVNVGGVSVDAGGWRLAIGPRMQPPSRVTARVVIASCQTEVVEGCL